MLTKQLREMERQASVVVTKEQKEHLIDLMLVNTDFTIDEINQMQIGEIESYLGIQ
jgi:hypothetical protein